MPDNVYRSARAANSTAAFPQVMCRALQERGGHAKGGPEVEADLSMWVLDCLQESWISTGQRGFFNGYTNMGLAGATAAPPARQAAAPKRKARPTKDPRPPSAAKQGPQAARAAVEQDANEAGGRGLVTSPAG